MLNALEYYKKLKASKFDHIQGLMKDVAIINSNIYIYNYNLYYSLNLLIIFFCIYYTYIIQIYIYILHV